MFEVWWKTPLGWEKLHNSEVFTDAKQWALDHISYTSTDTIKVEIRSSEETYILWNKE